MAESECWEESSDWGEPCMTLFVAIGLLEEILPSQPVALLSLPTLSTGPI